MPILAGVRDLAAAGIVPGGSLENLAHVQPNVTWAEGQGEVEKRILADAQTSGGLLVAVAPGEADALGAQLADRGVDAVRIGEVAGPGPGRIACQRG